MTRSVLGHYKRLVIAATMALGVVSISPEATATLRVQNDRFSEICRVVAFMDSHRGTKVIYDGRLRRGRYKMFNSVGSKLCIQRSVVPQRCNSGLTRPVCKVDRHSNRTVQWTIQ
jgi:hypothetical protein